MVLEYLQLATRALKLHRGERKAGMLVAPLLPLWQTPPAASLLPAAILRLSETMNCQPFLALLHNFCLDLSFLP